ncbi:MAG TPA: hypothetical protein VF070_41110 [Streptosporangiaceae bacterium]
MGDRVAVGPSPLAEEVTAQPLVRWVTYTASLAELVPGRRLGGPIGPVVTRDTSVAPSLAVRRGSREWTTTRRLAVLVTDQVSTSTHRALAVREA